MFKLSDFNERTQAQIRSQLSAGNSGTPAVVESNPCHAPLAAEKVQRPTRAPVLVRVTSIRKRLLDQDNLCEKYHVDLCRYAGVIPDDAPDQVTIEVCQRKAGKGEEEHTIIEVL